MNYGLIPDIVAMAVLIAILAVLRLRHHKKFVDLWLVGLFFIFVEAFARLFYSTNHSDLLRRPTHCIALLSYMISALVFTATAGSESFSRSDRLFYYAINAIPFTILLMVYGWDITNPGLYLGCILSGLLIGIVSSIALRRGWLMVLVHLVCWVPMLAFLRFGTLRDIVYWGLFCLYLLAALCLHRALPDKSTGRFAIVTSLVIWSLCLLVHPWVLSHRVLQEINDQVWNMQKFLVTIGMVIVLLEDQIQSNQWLALHDQLTGLPNRRLFDDRLTQALSRGQRLRTSVALIMIDLDGFKLINDSHGHAAGDELLRGITANLIRIVRSSDTLARIGGDEFVVLAGDLPANQHETTSIARLVEAIHTAIRKPVLINGTLVSVSGSLGVAIAPDDAKTAAQLLQTADRRMYRLKKGSKSRPAHTIEPQIL
jgi:diguanylate cyclase